jgi:hypothetical protein
VIRCRLQMPGGRVEMVCDRVGDHESMAPTAKNRRGPWAGALGRLI